MAHDSYYITTPIYYVNDRPHIGHCYTTLVADVAARFQRLIRGPEGGAVFFLTGTDEHADKVVTSAAKHNVSPQEWADINAAEFQKAFAFLHASHDDFIRTTEPRHKERAERYIRALMESGAIYKGEYTGWYDEGQEEYVTETAAREADFKSTISSRPLVRRTEPCYFFRLSQYQEHLRRHIEENPGFVQPESRRSEILGRIKAGLNDVPVSRPVTSDPATQWGIRVPGDAEHRVYVWIDALFNYLSTIDTDGRRGFWPADVHVIGKDILWFHAGIWPALLMALRESGEEYAWVALPRTVFGHGWWVADGQKMSKSLGNFIDIDRLEKYAARYGLDALRWFLATQGPLAGNDADFSHAKFVEAYNADLANGIGNSVSRVGNMIAKYFGGVLPEYDAAFDNDGPGFRMVGGTEQFDFNLKVGDCLTAVSRLTEDFSYHPIALRGGVELVQMVDKYIGATRPFDLGKKKADDPEAERQLAVILRDCVEGLRIATLLMYPAIPGIAQLWQRWGCSHLQDANDPNSGFIAPLAKLAEWGGEYSLKAGAKVEKGDALFMRADPAEDAPA